MCLYIRLTTKSFSLNLVVLSKLGPLAQESSRIIFQNYFVFFHISPLCICKGKLLQNVSECEVKPKLEHN